MNDLPPLPVFDSAVARIAAGDVVWHSDHGRVVAAARSAVAFATAGRDPEWFTAASEILLARLAVDRPAVIPRGWVLQRVIDLRGIALAQSVASGLPFRRAGGTAIRGAGKWQREWDETPRSLRGWADWIRGWGGESITLDGRVSGCETVRGKYRHIPYGWSLTLPVADVLKIECLVS